MSSLKSNSRSFRYSDEVKNILEQQEGDSLNAKFENLILYCFWQLPKIKKEIKSLEKRKAELEEDISDRLTKINELRNLTYLVERIERDIKSYSKSVESYCNTK